MVSHWHAGLMDEYLGILHYKGGGIFVGWEKAASWFTQLFIQILVRGGGECWR
jgi:hypothetical protein